MFSVIEGEEHLKEKEYKLVRKRSSSSPNKDQVKTRLREEDQSVIASGDCYQVGYRDIHSKQPCKDVSRSQVKYHHPRHQAQTDTSLSSENLLYSTEDKLAMDSSIYPPKKPTKPYRKKKKLKVISDRRDEYSLHSDINDQTESGSENGFALKNVCNNSNGGVGGISCWDEVRKSICPEEAKIVPSAAFLEHDIISKQRKEILLLMEELGTRDQELNDLVRSHQSQVKAWESDRHKLKDLQQRLSNYEKELERSDDNLQLTLEEMKQVTDQKELDGLELKKTKGDMEKLSRKIQENSSYLKDMETQNKNLMDSVKKLVSVKEDLEIRGKNLSSRLKSKAGELNVQASEISRLNDQNKNLESKLANGNETIRNLKAEVLAWKNRYCTAKDETDRLTTDNSAKDAQLQNLTAQLHETLQQTLALQKALFTSCEREKCKEEIMLSLRKQQKRTMQEMTNLRKSIFVPRRPQLYEKQTKDLKLYHLSVQDGTKSGDKGHAGQGEMDDSYGPGLEKHAIPRGHKGEKTSTKAHDQSQHFQGTNRGRQSERKHRSSSDKNMRYESRDQSSSFLVKKERDTPSPQASQENEIGDERKAFICSVHSDLDDSDASSGKDHQRNASSLLGGKADKENGNASMSKKRKEIIGDTDFTSTLSSRHAEKLNRRSKSLSSETKGQLTKTTHCRPLSCSRGTSPINLGDRAISPTTHFFTAHENSASLNSDMNFLSEDLKICKSNSNKGDVLRNGSTVEETKHDVGMFKESARIDIIRDAWSGMKRAPHDETSGVCLSSSECSSSTLSSVGRERALDELTPADSDGMCSELQRKFVPNSHKSSYSLHDRSDVKTNFIHLRNTPTVIEDTQGQSHTSDRTRYFSEQRDGVDGSVPKANKFVGKAYRLVDKKENEDSTVVKEKWSERSGILNSSIGLCRESEKINGHAYDDGDVRTDLSSGHKDLSCVVSRQCAKLSSHQVSNLDTSNHKTPCENNNKQTILKVASENNDSKLGYRTQSLSLTHGIDNSSLCQHTQSRHLSSQFNKDRDKAKDNTSRVDIQSRLQSRPTLIGRCVRVISPLRDDPETKAQCDMWSKGATTSHHQNATQSDSSCLESDTSLYSISTKSNYSCLKESTNVSLATPPVFNSSDNNDHKIQPHSFERQNRSADLIHKVGFTDNNNSEDKKRNYFYEENESTDSENAGGCKPRDDRILPNNNAYIVPVSSSTCSRPFLSTKGPSLYNHLSTIHYSEKSRRYEWGPQGPGQDAEQQKESHLRLHQQGKPSFVTFPKCDVMNKPSTSGNDPLRRSCTNNNNSSTEELGHSCTNNNNSTEEFLGQEEEELIDNLFQDASLHIVSSAVYHPNSNMDKFHHHYNNIVPKLGGSNVDTDEESLEESVDSGQPIFRLHPGAPERLKTVTKRSEMDNMKSDESIFSPSQICVKVSMTENSSFVVDNVVRQLDFSNMTCVDQSHLDLIVESPCASQFPNTLGLHSGNNKTVPARQRDQNAEKMNIPLDCPSTVCRHTPAQNHIKHETDLLDADNNGPLNDTMEANVEFQNISLQPDNEPFWNLCDREDQMKLDKVKILSMVDETNKSKTPREEKPSQETQPRVESGKDDVELVAASLPDYFPDISAVVADDESIMSVDEGGRGGGRLSGRRHCDDFDADVQILTPVDDESNGKQQQPYSHTSTPTKVRAIPVVSNCHTINDLNSPLCDNKHVHNVQEGTLLSKERDCFGVKNLLLDEESVECSSNVSEIDCDGDGIKKIVTRGHSHTKEKDKDRRVIDSEDILISIKETGYKMDMNSLYNDAGYYTLGKSSDRLEGHERFEHGTLCSSNVGNKQCNDAGAITKYTSTNAVQHTNGLKEEDDSSYLEGPSWDQMEDRQSNYPSSDTPRDKISDDHSKIPAVPMSPASKLHHLLLESQEMIRSLEMKTSLPR